MATIKTIKDNNKKIYPVTHSDAVWVTKSSNLSSVLSNMVLAISGGERSNVDNLIDLVNFDKKFEELQTKYKDIGSIDLNELISSQIPIWYCDERGYSRYGWMYLQRGNEQTVQNKFVCFPIDLMDSTADWFDTISIAKSLKGGFSNPQEEDYYENYYTYSLNGNPRGFGDSSSKSVMPKSYFIFYMKDDKAYFLYWGDGDVPISSLNLYGGLG